VTRRAWRRERLVEVLVLFRGKQMVIAPTPVVLLSCFCFSLHFLLLDELCVLGGADVLLSVSHPPKDLVSAADRRN